MSSPDRQTTWVGHYYDGRTTARHPVIIVLAPSGLELTITNGARAWWPYSEVTQTQGSYEREPVRLERGGPIPETIIVDDPAFLAALRYFSHRDWDVQQFAKPPDRGDRFRTVLLAGLASIALTAAIIAWGIPTLAELVTPLIPISWEIALGKSVVQQLAPADHRCTDGRLRENVDALMARLAAARPGAPYPFHITIVDGPVFNAFAAPGGQIVVYRKMLQATETPEELAGVLAHEMQHIYHRHAMKALVRDLSLAALVGAVFGDVTGAGAFAVGAGRTLTTLHYNRETEAEADREGLYLLQAARVDPAGMVRFFETLKKHAQGIEMPAYLSTHPESNERMAQLKALAGSSSSQTEPLLPDVKWGEIKMLCR